MEELKEYLLKNKIFTKKELKTLQQSKINQCNMCNKTCGQQIKLNECKNNIIICLECLDLLYDNYHLHYNDDKLFKCVCCEQMIESYEMI